MFLNIFNKSKIIVLLIIWVLFFFAGCNVTELFVRPSPTPTATVPAIPRFDAKVIRIGVDSSPASLLIYAINHYIPANTFKVEPVLVEDVNQRWQLLASGEIDMAMASLPEFVLGASRHNPGAFVCWTSVSNGTEAILVKNNIKSVKELTGKKIITTPGSSCHFFLISILNSQGKSTAEIDLFPVDSKKEVLNLYKTGSGFDAAVMEEPYLNRAESMNNKNFKLLASSQPPRTISRILAAGDIPLKYRTKDIQTVVNAYYQLVDFILLNPGLAKKLIATRSGKSIEEIDLMFETVKLKSLDAARAPSRENIIDEMRKIHQVWSIEGLPNAGKTLNYNDLVDYNYLDEAEIKPAEPIFEKSPEPAPTFFTPSPTPDITPGESPIPPTPDFPAVTETPEASPVASPIPETPLPVDVTPTPGPAGSEKETVETDVNIKTFPEIN